MEPWKGAAIGAMLLLIVGYGVVQNRPLQDGTAGADAVPGAKATETPDPTLTAWIGKEPLPWSFPAQSWVNTPRPLTPTDLKGKITLIEFWRRGCSHCEDAVPFMNTLKSHFGPKLQIITFQSPGVIDDPENPENSWPQVKDWIKAHNIQYPVAFDEGRKLKNQYQVALYPFVMVVNRQGKIVYDHTGHTSEKARALGDELQKLILEK